VTREVAEREAIRDHFVVAWFERFIARRAGYRKGHHRGLPNPFANAGVSVEVHRL
jgi:hypothetical protein